MKRTDLRLNDFDGFERFLFTDAEMEMPEEERWRKYFGRGMKEGDPQFYQPIYYPETIEEFQCCHYAFWMVIFVYGLEEKPNIWNAERQPENRCYACEYEEYIYNVLISDHTGIVGCICPVKQWGYNATRCTQANSAFSQWDRYHDRMTAKQIAMLKWEMPSAANYTSPLIERSE